MLINLFGFVLLILFTIFAYKTAKEYGRNAIGWSLITFFAGIGIQIILPIFVVIIIFIVASIGKTSPQEIEDSIPISTITVVCIILSLVGGFLILQHLSKIPEDFDLPPAPPSDFNL